MAGRSLGNLNDDNPIAKLIDDEAENFNICINLQADDVRRRIF